MYSLLWIEGLYFFPQNVQTRNGIAPVVDHPMNDLLSWPLMWACHKYGTCTSTTERPRPYTDLHCGENCFLFVSEIIFKLKKYSIRHHERRWKREQSPYTWGRWNAGQETTTKREGVVWWMVSMQVQAIAIEARLVGQARARRPGNRAKQALAPPRAPQQGQGRTWLLKCSVFPWHVCGSAHLTYRFNYTRTFFHISLMLDIILFLDLSLQV